MRSGSGVYSISRHTLSAKAATQGKPKVAASPLMSWAAWNSDCRVSSVKPFALTASRARSSRSHSASIHSENSLASRASAASARATGSSADLASRPGNTARCNLFGGMMTSWSA